MPQLHKHFNVRRNLFAILISNPKKMDTHDLPLDNSRTSRIIAWTSLAISVITLFFSYIKPQFFDSASFHFYESKNLTIIVGFGNVQLNKDFSIVNTGKKHSLFDDIRCYLITDKSYNTVRFSDVYYISDPDYITNDRRSRFNRLYGFTLWENNGYDNGLYYLVHHDQNYLKVFQNLRDSAAEEMRKFNDNTKVLTKGRPKFTYSNSLKNNIINAQALLKEPISAGDYFICERLINSEGNKYYQVYLFTVSPNNVEHLNKITTEIINQANIQVSQLVTVDLKLASKEERNKIIKKVEEFEAKFD